MADTRPPLPKPHTYIWPEQDCRHEVCYSPSGPGQHYPVWTEADMRIYAAQAVAEAVEKERERWIKAAMLADLALIHAYGGEPLPELERQAMDALRALYGGHAQRAPLDSPRAPIP